MSRIRAAERRAEYLCVGGAMDGVFAYTRVTPKHDYRIYVDENANKLDLEEFLRDPVSQSLSGDKKMYIYKFARFECDGVVTWLLVPEDESSGNFALHYLMTHHADRAEGKTTA